MARIKGIKIKLYNKVPKRDQNGELVFDEFNRQVFEEVEEIIENVLVTPASSDDITDSTNLHGKKAVYTLAIPKEDTHDWRDKRVEFFGETFRTFGLPVKGIDHLIPLDWNAKIKVERYE